MPGEEALVGQILGAGLGGIQHHLDQALDMAIDMAIDRGKAAGRPPISNPIRRAMDERTCRLSRISPSISLDLTTSSARV